ncbi:hypothetical protein NKG05_22575 [Oerskovia sp. M15]
MAIIVVGGLGSIPELRSPRWSSGSARACSRCRSARRGRRRSSTSRSSRR